MSRPVPFWVKAVALAGLLAAVLYEIDDYGQVQFARGETVERAAWVSRDNTALRRANARIKAMEEHARAQEREHANDMAAAAASYQEDLKHEQATKDRVIADLRRGDRRLRVPVVAAVCAPAAGGSGAAAAGAGAAGRDGETRAELSFQAAEFLVGLTNEADAVAIQLTACQAVVTADRKLKARGNE